MSEQHLSVEQFAAQVGCTPGRLRLLYRAGLLTPWREYLQLTDVQISAEQQLVVAMPNGPQMVRFHRELLTDPRLFILALNKINPDTFGPGWQGVRYPKAKLEGTMETECVKLVAAGRTPGRTMNRICRLLMRTRATRPA